jgi:hypothetical protein
MGFWEERTLETAYLHRRSLESRIHREIREIRGLDFSSISQISL